MTKKNAAAEARAAREAQERDEREAREAELAAERERQAEEQRRLDAERARLEKDRCEAAAKVERDRLANLGLREAVHAVINYFQGEEFHAESKRTGFRIPKCIGDLDVALANDAAPAKPARGKRAAA